MRRVLLPVRRPAVSLLALLAGLSVSVGVGAVATPAFAAPVNDNFSDAAAIAGTSGSVSLSLVGATLEAGEPKHYGYGDDPAAMGHSVWYAWTAPLTGRVKFRADNGSVVDVYTGSALTDLQPADFPCDGTSRGWTPHCKRAYVTAGTRYRIAVDGYEAGNTLSWQLFTAPANDAFANPVALDGLDVSFPAIEDGGQFSTAEPGEPQHYRDIPASRSVWYQWTATWSSQVSIGVNTGGYVDGENCTPTFLAAYTGSSLTNLSRVASDSGNYPECGFEGADVSFTAVAGTTYRIAVDSAWNGDAGRLSGALQAAPFCSSSGSTAGGDTLIGTAGNDVLCGLEGDDVIKGQGGDDLLIGGPGVDSASYADAPNGVVANLTTASATGHGTDTLQDIESLIGSRYNDKLDGNAGINFLTGGAGVDALWGQAGVDTLAGLAGNDTLGAGAGNDRIDGGVGIDTAHFGASPAPVTVNLTTGSATGEGTDTLVATESVLGSPGADRLTGSGGVNTLQGAGGNDTVAGSGGNDKLYGAGGNDALTGGTGTDLCDGGTETDTAATCESKVAIP